MKAKAALIISLSSMIRSLVQGSFYTLPQQLTQIPTTNLKVLEGPEKQTINLRDKLYVKTHFLNYCEVSKRPEFRFNKYYFINRWFRKLT
jgi:hypothetical protein